MTVILFYSFAVL